jgi:uncharacterized protein (DUF2267 family)
VDAQRFTTFVQEAAGIDEGHATRAKREGVDAATAERDARAVFTALGYAVSPGELADAAAQLPQEFARLLPRGPWVDPPTADEFAGRIARRTGLDGERAGRSH